MGPGPAGRRDDQQLPDADSRDDLRHPTAVSAGNNHYLVRCVDGTVVSWGINSQGQVGVGSTAVSQYNAAQTVVGIGGAGTLANVTAVAAGYNASYALRGDGTVVAWGYN
ncbi:MAG TPA: hypothetical protein PLO00_11100, partial [Usitatibacteraceae bacterium]|nr:hypothetical protein [Usitatibacteraceae bacterium]